MSTRFNKQSMRARSSAAGMTLIEVLVTLVIVSVGLLGIAALQLTTVRNNYDAFVRSQAAVLAGDMLDRIRASHEDATAYAIGYGESEGTDDIAADITAWKETLEAQLPNGDGSIVTREVTTGSMVSVLVTVNIRWSERGEDDYLVFSTSSRI